MTFLSQKNILLSISILISNRPDTVEKCLRSLDSLRSRVPSELILVDTGCGEQVRKMIEPYADKIVEFEWCNDFAKARNAGLKQAKGEWFLYLDDDEWFENTDEIEDFFLSDKHLYYNYGSYLVRNYFNMEGTRYQDTYVGRLVRLYPDLEFIYSIHEVFSKALEPWIRLRSYVHHYGYAFKNEEEARRHGKRNIELLLAEHEKSPKELRHNVQLAQEYNRLKEFEKSIEISWAGIRNAGAGRSTEQFLGGLYVNIVRNYVVLGQYSDAVKIGEEYLGLRQSNELSRAVVCYNLCIAYLEIGEYAKSIEVIEWYQSFYEKWKKNREATAFYESMEIPFLCEDCKQTTICVGVQSSIKLENTALARKFFDEIDWSNLNLMETQSVLGIIQMLIRAWLSTDADRAKDYTAMMSCLLKDGGLAGKVAAEIELLQRSTPELLQTKQADWTTLAKESRMFLYFKIKNGVETDSIALTEDYINLWKEPLDVLMKAKELELWELARRDGVNMEQIISGIPMYRWERAVEIAARELTWQEIQDLQVHLQRELAADSFPVLYWNIHYRMRKIQIMAAEKYGEGVAIGGSVEDIVQELLAYAAENESLCRRLFREELLREAPELLPPECQVSLKLTDMAEAVKKEDFQRALSDVREALEIIPELSNALKCCTRWLSEKLIFQKTEQEKARAEMRRLARIVKTQVRNLAAQGMLIEAMGSLKQLKALVPEDEEVTLMEWELLQSMAEM